MAATLTRSNASVAPTQLQQVRRSPALSALSKPVSNGLSTIANANVQRVGQQMAAQANKPAQPNATNPYNTGYTPNTSLNADQKANYAAEFANNDKNAQTIQDIGNRNIAAMSRKNAALAALSGSGGGAAYLSGQRAALSTGLATEQNALLANNQARDAIYQNQAGQLGSLAQGAQGYENTVGVNAIQRGQTLQDQGNSSGASYVNNVTSTADSRWANRLKDWSAGSAGTTDYNNLKSQVNAAMAAVPPGQDPSKDPAVQAAIQALNAFNGDSYDSKGNRK